VGGRVWVERRNGQKGEQTAELKRKNKRCWRRGRNRRVLTKTLTGEKKRKGKGGEACGRLVVKKQKE